MALSAPRNTLTKGRDLLVLPVAAATVIHQGGLVAVTAAGLAVPGAGATTLTAAGRAEESADNAAGAASAMTVTVRRGVFLFKNHGADAVVQADVLKDCFIVDDETVAKTNGGDPATRSRAGKVLEVGSAGVWVEIG